MFCSVEGCGRKAWSKGFCTAHYFRARNGDVRADEPIGAKKNPPECTVDGCEKKTYAKGLCGTHYRRVQRNGHTELLQVPGLKTCSVEGCDNISEARGLCHGHYQRVIRGSALSDEDPLTRKRDRTCSVEGCDRPVKSWGLCSGHKARVVNHGDVRAERPLGTRPSLDTRPLGSPTTEAAELGSQIDDVDRPQPVNVTCSVEGCDRDAFVHGLCSTHDQRRRKLGDVRADVPIRVVGGKGYVQHGYRCVPVPKHERHLSGGKSMIREHRLVMARQLQRPLTSEESVHHRNGEKLDNRSANLELWTRSQPYGARVEDKVRWAKELLRLYEPDALNEAERARGDRGSEA